jgi:hypothetical protein
LATPIGAVKRLDPNAALREIAIGPSFIAPQHRTIAGRGWIFPVGKLERAAPQHGLQIVALPKVGRVPIRRSAWLGEENWTEKSNERGSRQGRSGLTAQARDTQHASRPLQYSNVQ